MWIWGDVFSAGIEMGTYGLLFFLSAALSTTELWWQMNHRKSFRTLLRHNHWLWALCSTNLFFPTVTGGVSCSHTCTDVPMLFFALHCQCVQCCVIVFVKEQPQQEERNDSNYGHPDLRFKFLRSLGRGKNIKQVDAPWKLMLTSSTQDLDSWTREWTEVRREEMVGKWYEGDRRDVPETICSKTGKNFQIGWHRRHY